MQVPYETFLGKRETENFDEQLKTLVEEGKGVLEIAGKTGHSLEGTSN